MIWRSLSDIAFSDAKQLLVGWRELLGLKDKEFKIKSFALLQNCKMKSKKVIVVLKCKKVFLFEKIDKNVQFSFLFLENS